MPWTFETEIPYYICDYTDHLSAWSLARIFQDAADSHTEYYHVGFSDLMQHDQAWVLSRIHYRYLAMPRALQHITVRTWSRRADRLSAIRDTEMVDKQGKVMAASTSMWVIMGMKSRRVEHMIPDVVNFAHESRMATDIDILHKIKLPPMSDDHLMSCFPVQHSAIDHNLHVNNSDYIRWIVDALKTKDDAALQDSVHIDSLEINYFMETHQGEEVKVFMQSSTDTPHAKMFQLSNPRGIASTAIVKLK